MRGLTRTLLDNWHPILVIGVALTALGGVFATLLNLTAWFAPRLGPWPSVAIAATLVGLGATHLHVQE